MGEFSPPLFWVPFFVFFFLSPQSGFGSITLLQKFTPHSKSWIRACLHVHFDANLTYLKPTQTDENKEILYLSRVKYIITDIPVVYNGPQQDKNKNKNPTDPTYY